MNSNETTPTISQLPAAVTTRDGHKVTITKIEWHGQTDIDVSPYEPDHLAVHTYTVQYATDLCDCCDNDYTDTDTHQTTARTENGSYTLNEYDATFTTWT